MYSKIIFAGILFGAAMSACNNSTPHVLNPMDYNHYLEVNSEYFETAKKEYAFWAQKLQEAPGQFPYLGKIASANTQLFEMTGDVEYLLASEKQLIELNVKTNYNKAGYLRALARNYITQHRFKESLSLLKKAEKNGESLAATQKMLFDVCFELGSYDQAQAYLSKIEDFGNFDYLIRLAKWQDHKGNLDEAIYQMENALAIAESSKNRTLQQWTYTNLADFYGHAGRISESYNYYLKALVLNPNDVYALKGIAWIAYSYERNPDEALKILNTISKQHRSPDYYLFKAELAEFNRNELEKRKNLEKYLNAAGSEIYGDMYNKYLVQLYTDEFQDFKAGLKVAKEEISHRPTPQSYDLLAWLLFRQGDHQKALDIMENHVVNQTFEPKIQYHLAVIYKANGKTSETKVIKEALLASIFELGPNMEKKIKLL